MLNICAIIAVRNGSQTLPAVLQHFQNNRIDVVIIDNGSTDQTLEIVARFKERPVKKVIHFSFDGVFELAKLLYLKQEAINSTDAEWIIHADADEIFDSPKEGESLREFIERCSSRGFDVIDCDEFVFVPRNEAEDFHGCDFVNEMTHYYLHAPKNVSLHRFARKGRETLDWAKTAGHRIDLSNRRICPERARLRHYMGLSLDHLRSQYLGRVFPAEQLEKYWHRKRVPVTQQFITAPPPGSLFCLHKDGWRTDKPKTKHLVFHQEHPYVPPEKIVDSTNQQPVPFIIGVGKLETDLLRLLLDSHPNLAITPETPWLLPGINSLTDKPHRAKRFQKKIMSHPAWPEMQIDKTQLKQIIKEHDKDRPFNSVRKIYAHYARTFGKKRYGDKTPDHGLSMQKIASALPEAHFIQIIRDGRDVAACCKNMWVGSGWSIRAMAMFWMWRIREMRQQAQFVPHYLEIRYEDLIHDTGAVLKQIGQFIGVPYDAVQPEACLGAEERVTKVTDNRQDKISLSASEHRSMFGKTFSPTGSGRTGRWKHELAHEEVVAFERIAGDMLSDLGYAGYSN